MNFKRLNTIVGWAVFLIALTTYTLTMEKTGSLWDCGEFLSCTYKLQVAHPPGAPFFMMVGKVFSLLAMGDISRVAMMINWLSAVSTAFTVLFFYWSVVIMMRMVLSRNTTELSASHEYFIIGSSFLGALAATFLDSMWFNALEGEVYAFSVFFMAFNVWAILRWKIDESPKRDLWLLLIGLFTGMSLGVHLLSLLAFPFVFLVIYFDKFKFSWLGFFITFGIGMVFIQLVMNVMLVLTPLLLGKIDLLFVNSFNLPFYSGSIFGIFALIGLFIYLIRRSLSKPNFLWWNEDKIKFPLSTVLLFIAFMYMGFTSYFMVVIRANANPPINMNVPNNFLTLKSYIAREQYEDRPLAFGPHYPDLGEIEDYDYRGTLYEKNVKEGKYVEAGKTIGYKYPSRVKRFFPRLGHSGEDKKQIYRAWLNPPYDVVDRATGSVVQSFGRNELEAAEKYAQEMNSKGQAGQYVVKDRITFFDNLSYFINFQIGFMYFRYLMWNFSGRTDELQGTVSNDHGRWIIGISPIDDLIGSVWGHARLSQSGKPEILASNPAHNKFYMIPFILCVMGAIALYRRDREIFSLIIVLFVTTGIFQIIFHNQPPQEPRERDYAVALSFWVFAMFMPFGAWYLYQKLQKVASSAAAPLALVLTAIAPILMGFVGWDDHNRGNRTSTLDFAYNTLNSCPPNAILFAYGDNDTYPLWYAQEIENIRPDVRVVNTSLIEGAPYISQLLLPMNDNAGYDLGFPIEKIRGDLRQVLRTNGSPLLDSTLSFDQIVAIAMSDNSEAKTVRPDGEMENFLATTNAYFKVDKDKAIKSGKISPEAAATLPDRVPIKLPSTMTKGSLVQLQLINRYMLERPVCFVNAYSPRDLGISNYLETRGMVVVFNPFAKSDIPGLEPMDINNSLKAVNNFRYGKIKNGILVDENTYKSYISIKTAMGVLALNLAVSGKNDSAIKILDKLYDNIPLSQMKISRYDGVCLQAASYAKSQKHINLLTQEMYKSSTAVLDWLTNQTNIRKVNPYSEEVSNNLSMLSSIVEIAKQNNLTKLANDAESKLKVYEAKLNSTL